MKILKVLLSILLLVSLANAKPEPTNWMFGIGVGSGISQIDKKYPESANNKLGVTGQWHDWSDVYGSTVKDWGVNWEVLVGYKHYVNDWVGFRYYATVGAQHYKDDVFTAGKVEAGVIEYIANADVLINFWTEESWSVGMFAGLGIGGAYFNSKALDTYASLYTDRGQNSDNVVYKGEGKVYKNHVSAAINLGLRGSYFQKVRNIEARVCDNREGSRRTCKVPVNYYEHSFEFAAKVPLVKYEVTDPGDTLLGFSSGNNIPGSAGQPIAIVRRPGYIVSNPFKFTVRYIFAF